MNLRFIVYLFLVILFLPFICFAQEVQLDSSKENYKHEFQFYVVNDIIVAYKYQLCESSAFRLILNATGLFNDQEADEIQYIERTTDTLLAYENRQNSYSNHSFGIKFQYLFNTKLHRIIQLYFGGGPFVNYNFIQREDWYKSYSSNSQPISNIYNKSSENIWFVGISAVAGIECTIYNNINIFAEYEAVIEKGWRNIDQYSHNNTYINNNEYHIWGYTLQGIRLGVGIYF